MAVTKKDATGTTRNLVETRNTRTGEPRKVDEWKIRLPDGTRASFDVRMIYQDDQAIFSLRSDAPHFAKCNLMHSDPNALRQMLEGWAAEVIEREISVGWAPAVMAETRVERREDEGRGTRFSLSINFSRVEHMPDDPVGNRGETVIRGGRVGQSVVVQRALKDDFSDCSASKVKGGILSDEARDFFNSPFRSEHGDPVSRVVTEDFEGMNAALDTIEAFSLLLADRMSAQAIRDQGPVQPDDLVAMMQRAALGCKGPTSVPLADNEFRM